MKNQINSFIDIHDIIISIMRNGGLTREAILEELEKEVKCGEITRYCQQYKITKEELVNVVMTESVEGILLSKS